MPTSLIPFGASTGIVEPGVGSAVADATGLVSASTSAATTDIGRSYVYTVVVQLPLPFVSLNLDLNLLGNFVLPALTALSIPKALLNFTSQAQTFFNNVLEDAQTLIKAIPEATVRIVIKIGPAILVNVLLVAEKVPVNILPPTFQLALPNLGADALLNLPVDGQSVTVRVPIPYPVVTPVPLLKVSGGQVSASASTSTSAITGSNSLTAAAGAGATSPGASVATGVAVPALEDPIVVVAI